MVVVRDTFLAKKRHCDIYMHLSVGLETNVGVALSNGPPDENASSSEAKFLITDAWVVTGSLGLMGYDLSYNLGLLLSLHEQ